MSLQSSAYPESRLIQLFINKSIKTAIPPLDVQFLPDDVTLQFQHDFSLEKGILQNYESYNAGCVAREAAEKELDTRKRQLEKERLQLAKEEEVRKAPGLNTDGSILLPTTVANKSDTDSSGNVLEASNSKILSHKSINLTEFDALAPADPWERNDDNHIRILSEVMTSTSLSSQQAGTQGRPPVAPSNQSKIPPPVYNMTPPLLNQPGPSRTIISSNSVSSTTRNTVDQQRLIQPTPVLPPRPKSQEEERMHNYIQMGFSKDAVARAVCNYGQDDKKIVEFLISFQELVHTNTLPADIVEMGLVAYFDEKDPIKLSREFTLAFLSLQELGFSPEHIRNALVATKNKKDEALDLLIGGK